MRKICFVGGPGVGKTVLATDLVNALKVRGFNARFVEEYVSKYILECGVPISIYEQFLIALKQKEKEDAVARINPDFVVCDAASFLAYVYGTRYEEDIPEAKRRKVLQELLDFAHQSLPSYDLIFFIPQEIECKEDGVRFNVNDAAEISEQIESMLKLERVKYFTITSSSRDPLKKQRERLRKVLKIVLSSS